MAYKTLYLFAYINNFLVLKANLNYSLQLTVHFIGLPIANNVSFIKGKLAHEMI